MKRLELAELYRTAEQKTGQAVTVSGWIKTQRDSGSIGFIELNDGSTFKNLQVVLEEHKVPNFKEVAKLGVGAALSVTGTVVESPGAKQPFEIHATQIEIEGLSSPNYPLQKKRQHL